jgi:CheY-like chemotaxis protein
MTHRRDCGQSGRGFPKVAEKISMKQGIEILVVDDDQAVREALKDLLEYSGHTVRAVESGQEALALLAWYKFDVVITDFRMPKMRGDQLVANIRQHLPNQRIIMVTAYIEDYAVLGKPSTSVDALLFKPFSFNELNQIIERVLTGESVFKDSGAHPDTAPGQIHARRLSVGDSGSPACHTDRPSALQRLA